MNLASLQRDPAAFRNAIIIDCDGTPTPLKSVIEPWQQCDFSELDPAWKILSGQQAEASYQRAWLERPRGHSKTSDIAVQCCYGLFASKKEIRGLAAAADRDQAALLRDAIQRLVRLNNWLGQFFEIQTAKIINKHTGSFLEIISSDAASSYGHIPDFVVCDEVCHWIKRDLFDSLLSSAAKRKNCLFLCITNAGFRDSWQFEIRTAIENHRAWYFSRLDGPQASWITKDRLDEQKQLLPSIAFDRLWLNQWSSGSGDALNTDDIEAAIILKRPIRKKVEGWQFFAGLDLGLSKDAAALCLIGKHIGHFKETRKPKKLSDRQKMMIEAGLQDAPDDEIEIVEEPATGKIRLAQLHVWRPSANRKVDIEEIESTITALYRKFQFEIGCDPWQTAYLQERMKKQGLQVTNIDFLANNLKSMCSAVLEAFSNRQIELYNEPNLLYDLRNLRVVEKSYGVRLESPRGLAGHGDSSTALSIALHLARTKIHFPSIRPSDKIIAI